MEDKSDFQLLCVNQSINYVAELKLCVGSCLTILVTTHKISMV